MNLSEALQVLLPQATSWAAVAWIVVGSLRYLQAGEFVTEWLRPWQARRWARELRRLGATDKQIREFVIEYALRNQGRSP